jgi:hypothetical protein
LRAGPGSELGRRRLMWPTRRWERGVAGGPGGLERNRVGRARAVLAHRGLAAGWEAGRAAAGLWASERDAGERLAWALCIARGRIRSEGRARHAGVSAALTQSQVLRAEREEDVRAVAARLERSDQVLC